MSSDYIERNGAYYVKGARVSLDSLVYCFTEVNPQKPFARIFLH